MDNKCHRNGLLSSLCPNSGVACFGGETNTTSHKELMLKVKCDNKSSFVNHGPLLNLECNNSYQKSRYRRKRQNGF